MVIAMITLPTLPRVSAISAMASRIGGIDISPSITRMTMPSAQRTKPETRPIDEPDERGEDRDREADDERHARAVEHARIDVAARACRCRTSTSAEGSRVRRAGASAVGSTVPRQGANTAISSISSSSAPPTAIVGWRRTKPTKPRRGFDRRQHVGQLGRGRDAMPARRWRRSARSIADPRIEQRVERDRSARLTST